VEIWLNEREVPRSNQSEFGGGGMDHVADLEGKGLVNLAATYS